MSFRFNEKLFRDEEFNDKIKEKLTNLLTKSLVKTNDSVSSDNHNSNVTDTYSSIETDLLATTTPNKVSSSRSPNFLKDEIKITKVDFPVIPKVEILDMDITTEPRSLVKTIGNISCSDVLIQLETIIESNLLMSTLQNSPSFITPKLIDNNSFKIPITMVFSDIHLEAIINVFMRNYGVSISFNDVSLDFKFDCSIKVLQNTIEKRLKDSIASIFKEVLPSAIFNTSQHWLSKRQTLSKSLSKTTHPHLDHTTDISTTTPENKIIFDENDLQDISAENMSRLSSIISSRNTLSLHGTKYMTNNNHNPNNYINFSGCLERQNLYRFISTMPSLQNFYHNQKTNNNNNNNNNSICNEINGNKMNATFNNETENFLPQSVLNEGNFKLNDIIKIQNKLFERNYHNSNNNVQPKNRVIRLNKKSKPRKSLPQEEPTAPIVQQADKIISVTPVKKSEIEVVTKTDTIESKLSPKVKQMNKFVDSLLNHPILNTNTKKAESPLPSPTLTKSIGFAGLNPYTSPWGYNTLPHPNNKPAKNTHSTIKNHLHKIANGNTPPISPPPYSLTNY